ncbi:MAG: hypothetical protein WC204_11055 [Elusimicrobiales bacterium]|jgi:hypothetical protein
MKINLIFLKAVIAVILTSGVSSANDFEIDLSNGKRQAAELLSAGKTAAPDPMPELLGNKWWSVNFLGSGHKESTMAALKFVDKHAFPDIAAAGRMLENGSNDESGHPDITKNGGDVKSLWFGSLPATRGGVMRNYEQFRFREAYERLGTLCHLTQDQAVPVHAANIEHGINDSFEGFFGNEVVFSAGRDNGELEPYDYYQAVQDETRAKLPGWTDPATGAPYWAAAPDAPPLGQDVTYGPQGRYGGPDNTDRYAVPPPANGFSSRAGGAQAWVSAHPEIRSRQLAVAGAATVSVLLSASRRLPPLVRDLSVSTVAFSYAEGSRTGYAVNFTIYDNRSPVVAYTASVYKDGVPAGVVLRSKAVLSKAGPDELMYSARLVSGWDGRIDSVPLPPGRYVMDLRAADADGNTTPDEVNYDDILSNDTRVEFTVR